MKKLPCHVGHQMYSSSTSNSHELGEVEDRGRQRSLHRAGLGEVEDIRGRQEIPTSSREDLNMTHITTDRYLEK